VGARAERARALGRAGALPGPAAFAAPAGFDGKQLVPQLLVPPGVMAPPPQGAVRLTTAQAAELEMARRRAQKAAEGKRANATAMRRAKRRAGQLSLRAEAAGPERPAARAPRDEDEDDQGDGEDDLEAKLANTKDEKEANRLKRCAAARRACARTRLGPCGGRSGVEKGVGSRAGHLVEAAGWVVCRATRSGLRDWVMRLRAVQGTGRSALLAGWQTRLAAACAKFGAHARTKHLQRRAQVAAEPRVRSAGARAEEVVCQQP